MLSADHSVETTSRSKLKVLSTSSGQLSPHLQVPSFIRYSVIAVVESRRVLLGLKRKQVEKRDYTSSDSIIICLTTEIG